MKHLFFTLTVFLGVTQHNRILAIYDYNFDSATVAIPNSFLRLRFRISRIKDTVEENKGCCQLYGVSSIPLLLLGWILSRLIEVVMIINFYGPMVSMVISMMRLIRHDFDGSDGKLRAALFIFYSLALLHGLCFYCWFVFREFLLRQLRFLARKQCGFGEWGPNVVRGYFKETYLKCRNDLSLPTGWNLVAYAVGLLDSVSRHDNLSGVRILDTWVVSRKRSRCIRPELSSSRRAIQSLISMLGWTSPILDVQEMRERAARIMADISEGLHIAQFPGALQSVSSLLEAAPRKRDQEALGLSAQGSEQKGMKEEESAFKPKGTKELILQGLLILERLAYDEHNCREIVNTQGLLSKITAPITSQAFLDADYDDKWVSILCSYLGVVSRLISAPGEAGTRLRHEISASKEPIHNMLRILEGNTNGSEKLQEPAIEILTELALGPTDKTKNFGETLALIFIGRSGDSRLRRKAGEALAKLLSTRSASGSAPIMEILRMDALVDVLVNDKECQICAAEILEHLYFRSERRKELSKEDVINILTKILGIIRSTKAERKADEVAGTSNTSGNNDEESQLPEDADQNKSSTEQNDEQSEERKLVAALLSLTVVICHKLIDANDSCFIDPVEELIKKLKDIIERNNDATADCLRIVKLTCQVVIAMMKLKPSCIKEFNEHNFKKVLSEALKTLSDLDNCMLFAGNDRELTKPAIPLASLVEEGRQLFNKAQEPGNISA